jgi:hypothetical protein
MPHSLAVLLLSSSLLSGTSPAQQVGGQSAATPRPARVGSEVAIVDLLQQSHDLDKQGPGGSHLYLLRMQTEQVLKLRPDLARAWANELFVLAQKEGATADQAFAMSILVRLDPDRAIELLHAMDSDPGSFSNAVTTPQMQLAQQVFEALVTRDGESALPIVEREAAFMGSAGRYPYSALDTRHRKRLRNSGGTTTSTQSR